MMTRKPSPAQLAARKRFAERSRAGTLKRATPAVKRTRLRNPSGKVGAPFASDTERAIDEGLRRVLYDMRERGQSLKAAIAELRARSGLSAAALARVEGKAGALVSDVKLNPRKRKRNPAKPTGEYFAQVANGAWVSGRGRVDATGYFSYPMRKSFSSAYPLSAAQAAAFKSYCDEHAMRCRIVPVESIDFAESTPGKLAENPIDHSNIERSAFKQGVHTGYGGGAVWTITKATARGEWVAIPRQADAPEAVRSMRLRGTLAGLSAQLRALDEYALKRNPVKPDNWAAPAFMVTHFPVNQAYALTWCDQIISVNVGAGAYQKLFSSRAELIDALRVRGLSVNKGGKVSGAVKVGSA